MRNDYVKAMSAFEGLQIKPTYLPIDIRLTVNEITNMLGEKKLLHVLFPHRIVINKANSKFYTNNLFLRFIIIIKDIY